MIHDLPKLIKMGLIRSHPTPIIFCLIGNAGAGKTTIAKNMETLGIPQFKSYTTRPKRIRYEDEYYFISKEDAEKQLQSENILAHTKYGGHIYFGLIEDILPVQCYIIDPAGCKYLINHHNDKFKIITIWVNGDRPIDESRSARKFLPSNIKYDHILNNYDINEMRIDLLKIILNYVD